MIVLPENTHPLDNAAYGTARKLESDLLNTEAAAAYLQKSVSWLLRRPDMPYLPGKPNLYRRADLDHWVSRNMFKPVVR